MKQEFLNFVNELMKASPELTQELMTDDIRAYLDILKDIKNEKPEITENGRKVLEFLQEHSDVRLWKTKDVADMMGVSSRSISGSFRKLVNDGFCEKMGQSPIIYALTEKGKNYKFIDDEN